MSDMLPLDTPSSGEESLRVELDNIKAGLGLKSGQSLIEQLHDLGNGGKHRLIDGDLPFEGRVRIEGGRVHVDLSFEPFADGHGLGPSIRDLVEAEVEGLHRFTQPGNDRMQFIDLVAERVIAGIQYSGGSVKDAVEAFSNRAHDFSSRVSAQASSASDAVDGTLEDAPVVDSSYPQESPAGVTYSGRGGAPDRAVPPLRPADNPPGTFSPPPGAMA